ncbi:hypothetical protein GCM10025787_03400 [Saccharopolyspora rosea]|uniref:GGDEF domain-containing protein n=1 Tax=Saccharopolyspora rosea TaxID=524884 RepID=A0ABW3FPQ5_9PSEU
MFAKTTAIAGVLGTAVAAGYARTLHRRLHTDPLTGLANRPALQRVFAGLQRRARAGELVGLLLCDLDAFKPVNDTHGHRVGDHLLQSIAATLTELTSGTRELAVRLSGDEFAVLLPGLEEVRGAEARARTYRTALAAERLVDGRRLQVTASVGAAVDTARDTTLSALLGHADWRMYQLKPRSRRTAVPAAPACPTARLRDHKEAA